MGIYRFLRLAAWRNFCHSVQRERCHSACRHATISRVSITGYDLKQKYLEFFSSNGHAAIAGGSLVPENDPTVLFTTAGMHPLVPYILGQSHASGNRLVNCQPCVRTGDIDAVGDDTHLTFFEMLGNWSLGSYFKEEAIRYSFEFLTARRWLNIDKERLHITVFAGDKEVERDRESAAIWRSLGVPAERIYFLSREQNWWGPAGGTGPCGPDTEMFIECASAGNERGVPGGAGSSQLEIWNDVFMQYTKNGNGEYTLLDRRCVDTGMGVERTICILQGVQSVYETELFRPILNVLEQVSGIRYGTTADNALRIIADHIKAAAMIIADTHDIVPSNIGQGYVVRRLLRRAIRHGLRIGVKGEFVHRPAQAVIDLYAREYPMLNERSDYIIEVMRGEERLFQKTLARGQSLFEKECAIAVGANRSAISGEAAFHLYDTYGFPLELTQELAKERGLAVDVDRFQHCFAEHRKKSQGQGAHVFKGGLAEQTEKTTRLHTATHLLHQALRDVLGNHVAQKGSNITAERLRFDFSHSQKVSPEQLRQVEQIINTQIQRNLTVIHKTMSLTQALDEGAIALFTDKYQQQVSTYRIGDYSFEVCGGPHVQHTSELGAFRIQKEQSSSQGVRRIKAALDN